MQLIAGVQSTDWGSLAIVGDSYGMLNTLFSGLAFIVIAATLIVQRRDLDIQRRDLSLQAQSTRRLAEAASRESFDRAQAARVARTLDLVQSYNSAAMIDIRRRARTAVADFMQHYGTINWRDNVARPEGEPLLNQKGESVDAVYALITFWAMMGRLAVDTTATGLIDRNLAWDLLQVDYVDLLNLAGGTFIEQLWILAENDNDRVLQASCVFIRKFMELCVIDPAPYEYYFDHMMQRRSAPSAPGSPGAS